MKNKLLTPLIIVLVAILIIGGLSLSKDRGLESPGSVKVGVIAPMSGEAAPYGDYVVMALRMSVEEFNKKSKVKIEAIYEDGKCDGKEAVNAYNKLRNIDGVKYIIGGFCSGETLAIAPLAENDHVVLFSAGSGSPEITNAGDYIFRNLASDDFTAKEIANVAIRNGDKEMVVIAEGTDYSQALKKTFEKYYKVQGGNVVLSEDFGNETTDFRTIISKAKGQDTKNIYLITQTYKTSGLILKQMKELGVSPKIYTNEGTVNGEALSYYDASYKGLLEGAIFTQPKFNEKNPKTATMLGEYKEKYGSTEGPIPTSYLATHYDAINILGEALEKSGNNPDKVKSYLYGIKNWPGTVGSFSFDENGDAVTEVEAKTVKDGIIVDLQ